MDKLYLGCLAAKHQAAADQSWIPMAATLVLPCVFFPHDALHGACSPNAKQASETQAPETCLLHLSASAECAGPRESHRHRHRRARCQLNLLGRLVLEPSSARMCLLSATSKDSTLKLLGTKTFSSLRAIVGEHASCRRLGCLYRASAEYLASQCQYAAWLCQYQVLRAE